MFIGEGPKQDLSLFQNLGAQLNQNKQQGIQQARTASAEFLKQAQAESDKLGISVADFMSRDEAKYKGALTTLMGGASNRAQESWNQLGQQPRSPGQTVQWEIMKEVEKIRQAGGNVFDTEQITTVTDQVRKQNPGLTEEQIRERAMATVDSESFGKLFSAMGIEPVSRSAAGGDYRGTAAETWRNKIMTQIYGKETKYDVNNPEHKRKFWDAFGSGQVAPITDQEVDDIQNKTGEYAETTDTDINYGSSDADSEAENQARRITDFGEVNSRTGIPTAVEDARSLLQLADGPIEKDLMGREKERLQLSPTERANAENVLTSFANKAAADLLANSEVTPEEKSSLRAEMGKNWRESNIGALITKIGNGISKANEAISPTVGTFLKAFRPGGIATLSPDIAVDISSRLANQTAEDVVQGKDTGLAGEETPQGTALDYGFQATGGGLSAPEDVTTTTTTTIPGMISNINNAVTKATDQSRNVASLAQANRLGLADSRATIANKQAQTQLYKAQVSAAMNPAKSNEWTDKEKFLAENYQKEYDVYLSGLDSLMKVEGEITEERMKRWNDRAKVFADSTGQELYNQNRDENGNPRETFWGNPELDFFVIPGIAGFDPISGGNLGNLEFTTDQSADLLNRARQ